MTIVNVSFCPPNLHLHSVEKIFITTTLNTIMNTTKYCKRCDQVKPIDEFYKKETENRHSAWCRECVYTSQKKRWVKRKCEAIALMGGKCGSCGYNRNYAALEFHHIDPSQKDFDWNKLRLHPWKTVVHELGKCVLLCSNCHREIHNPSSQIEDCISVNISLKSSLVEPTGICPHCNTPTYNTKFCSIMCSAASKRKIVRPTKEELIQLISTTPYTQIAKMYKVSDNAIRKWAKHYGITN